MPIERNPERCGRKSYDLIIVGGGIYGTMLADQAAARGKRTLLLERDDFGARTSFNSLRIIHGGLRYLQSLDLPRFKESVRERRWFLSEFPELVRPLPCLMPLYGRGMKRNTILRVALTINDVLSSSRNEGVRADNRLPGGRVVDREEVLRLFPTVDADGLQGGAIWHDAAVADSQRIVLELLTRASGNGADLLNYVEAETLCVAAQQVTGVRAIDRANGERLTFDAPVVINSTGPWSGLTATAFGANNDGLFHPSIAWNLLMNRAALSDYALAITPTRSGAPTYFLHPWKGRLLIGTGHAVWSGSPDEPEPSPAQLGVMLDDMNAAIPGLALARGDIQRVLAGLLPARARGSADISVRPNFSDHAEAGGPVGFFSVVGVKFTTARYVAHEALNRIFGRADERPAGVRPATASDNWRLSGLDTGDERGRSAAIAGLRRLIADESVVHLGDLVLRRTDLWVEPERARSLAPELCGLFPWDEARRRRELAMLDRELGRTGR